jgi:class 3 adenylate cyclase
MESKKKCKFKIPSYILTAVIFGTVTIVVSVIVLSVMTVTNSKNMMSLSRTIIEEQMRYSQEQTFSQLAAPAVTTLNSIEAQYLRGKLNLENTDESVLDMATMLYMTAKQSKTSGLGVINDPPTRIVLVSLGMLNADTVMVGTLANGTSGSLFDTNVYVITGIGAEGLQYVLAQSFQVQVQMLISIPEGVIFHYSLGKAEIDGEWMLSLTKRIYNFTDESIAIVFAAALMEPVSDILSSMTRSSNDDRRLFIIDNGSGNLSAASHGQVRTTSDQAGWISYLSPMDARVDGKIRSLSHSLGGDLRKMKAGTMYDVDGYLVMCSPMDLQNYTTGRTWTMVSAISKGEFYDSLMKSSVVAVVSCIVATIVASLIGVIVQLLFLSRPLGRLSKAMMTMMTNMRDENRFTRTYSAASVSTADGDDSVLVTVWRPTPVRRMLGAVTGVSFVTEVMMIEAARRMLRRVMRVMSHFVDPAVSRKIMEMTAQEKMDAEDCCMKPTNVTVVFGDIERFTPLTEFCKEKGKREKLMGALERLMMDLTDIARRNKGMLDKTMGDGIMLLWGTPEPDENHATHACIAVSEMLEYVETISEEGGWFREMLKAVGARDYVLNMRFGVSSGEALCGIMGQHSLAWTAMGDIINTGSRLEQMCKGFRLSVLVAGATIAMIESNRSCVDRSTLSYHKVGCVIPQGKTEPISVFTLGSGGRGTSDVKLMASMYTRGFQLFDAMDFAMAKQVFLSAAHSGHHKELSTHIAAVCDCLIKNGAPSAPYLRDRITHTAEDLSSSATAVAAARSFLGVKPRAGTPMPTTASAKSNVTPDDLVEGDF